MTVPMSEAHVQPIQSRVAVNGVELALYEWPGADPAVLFLHATGFHARLWDQVIAQLPGRHCFAVDLRGHGQSSKPEPPYAWRAFAEDTAALVQQQHWTGIIGVGHSIGGHALVQAAALAPGYFESLLLIDPVILPKAAYHQVITEEHYTARRRNEWASPDEMYTRFKDRAPFSSWQPAVLRDYCEYGLLPNPNPNSTGSYVLACPPRVEASIYTTSTAADIYDLLAQVTIPVRVVRSGRMATQNAARDLNGSPTVPDLAARFPHGEDIVLPDLSHFIPMEAPDQVAAMLQNPHNSE